MTAKTLEEKIEYHQQKLNAIKNKVVQRNRKQKEAERRERTHNIIVFSTAIMKLLDLDHKELENSLPYVLGLLDRKKEYIYQKQNQNLGLEILNAWRLNNDKPKNEDQPTAKVPPFSNSDRTDKEPELSEDALALLDMNK